MNENDKNYVYNGLITYLGNKRMGVYSDEALYQRYLSSLLP